MTADIPPLASPIDALYLIHNALRTEADRTEQSVEHLEVGNSFKALAYLLPILRKQLSEAGQLELLRLLLIDQGNELQDTMIAWIAEDVTDPERQILTTLTSRLIPAPSPAGSGVSG